MLASCTIGPANDNINNCALLSIVFSYIPKNVYILFGTDLFFWTNFVQFFSIFFTINLVSIACLGEK